MKNMEKNFNKKLTNKNTNKNTSKFNIIQTNRLNIGDISFNNKKLKLKADTKLIVGEDIMKATDLVESMRFVKQIKEKCGKSYSIPRCN